MSTIIYNSFIRDLATGAIDLDTDLFKVLLTTSAYTPLAAHDKRDDVTNEVVGTGYSAGGTALVSPTVTLTAANAWGVTWATLTAFAQGRIVRPTTGNGFLFVASTGGTTAAGEPTWPTTVGATVVDDSVTWTNIGRGVVVFDSADPAWPAATITARMAVVYKSRGGAASADELVCAHDFGSDVTSTAGTFTVVVPIEGWVALATGVP